MINSESEEDLETNSDTDFFGSLSAFKGIQFTNLY